MNATAAELPGWITQSSLGTLKLDKNIDGSVVVFDEKWYPTSQSGSSMGGLTSKDGEFTGTFTLENGRAFQLAQKVVSDKGEVTYQAAVKSTGAPVATKQVCLAFDLPVSKYAENVFTAGDAKIVLPIKSDDSKVILGYGNANEIQLPTASGILVFSSEKPLQYLVQDNRRYNGSSYSLRLIFFAGCLGGGK